MILPRLLKGQFRLTIQGTAGGGGRPEVFVDGKQLLPGKIAWASVDVTTGSPVLRVTLLINASRLRITNPE